MTEIEERLELAVAIALEASAIPRRYFLNDGLVIDRKADDSPVTRADKETEEFLRARIESACPDDTIVGEEFPDKKGISSFKWYLDPIDGTESFVRGVPTFGCMVAMEGNDTPALGVVAFPALGEIVYAARGAGAFWATDARDANAASDLTPRPARVSTTSDLNLAMLTTGGLDVNHEMGFADALARLVSQVKIARGWSDCYGHYLVATGRADIMLDPDLNVWDAAPLLPIIEEAGGRFSDLDGVATIHGPTGGPDALSTNGLLHNAVLAILRG